MPPSAMCLSVCYLFVSLVSSTATWWLSGSFYLVVRLPTSSLLSQWFFVVLCVSCRVDVLAVRLVGRLLFAILGILLIGVASRLLLVFAGELSERIAILALLVFLGPVGLLIILLPVRFLR